MQKLIVIFTRAQECILSHLSQNRAEAISKTTQERWAPCSSPRESPHQMQAHLDSRQNSKGKQHAEPHPAQSSRQQGLHSEQDAWNQVEKVPSTGCIVITCFQIYSGKPHALHASILPKSLHAPLWVLSYTLDHAKSHSGIAGFMSIISVSGRVESTQGTAGQLLGMEKPNASLRKHSLSIKPELHSAGFEKEYMTCWTCTNPSSFGELCSYSHSQHCPEPSQEVGGCARAEICSWQENRQYLQRKHSIRA